MATPPQSLANCLARPLIHSTPFAEGRTLVIDTATSACSVALFEGPNCIDARHEEIGRGHAERLIGLVADLAGGGRAAHIVVSCGPGSFTGIRIGVAAARGLGLGWGVPVTGYSTLAALAAQSFADHSDIDMLGVAMHGGHGEVFVETFARLPFGSTRASESCAVDAAAEALSVDHIVGTAADALVAQRGYGRVIEAALTARAAQLLPLPLVTLNPTPHYGRGADATPMR